MRGGARGRGAAGQCGGSDSRADSRGGREAADARGVRRSVLGHETFEAGASGRSSKGERNQS
eukprot:73394-Pyramimonas_sp.AAC.1